MGTQGPNILARLICGCSERLGGTTGHCAALYPAPQLLQGGEFGRGGGQKPPLHGQVTGHLQAVGGGLRGAPILTPHDLPAAPLSPDHAQKVLMGLLPPCGSAQQESLSAPDSQRPMQDALAPSARTRHPPWFPHASVAGRERWGCGEARLLEHHDPRALALPQPRVEPPVAWRHVDARRTRWWRGRFHRRLSRPRAQETLGRPTAS
jgi:hypothetical protein